MIIKKCVYVWSSPGPNRKALLDSLKKNLSPAEVSIIDGEELVQMFDAHPANKVTEGDPLDRYFPQSFEDIETFFLHLHHVIKNVIKAEMEKGKHVVVSLEFWQYWPAWAISKDLLESWENIPEDVKSFFPDFNILIPPSATELLEMSVKDRGIFDTLLALYALHIQQESKKFFVSLAESSSPLDSSLYKTLTDYFTSEALILQP